MTSPFFDFPPNDLLGDRWRRHAAERPEAEAIIHWVAGEEPVRWRWRELVCRAETMAGWLVARGVRPGQVCALIIRHHPQFYPLYLAVSLCGALPAVLAYPNPRLHPDKFRQGLEGMAQSSGLDWVLTERDLEPILRVFFLKETATIGGMLFPFDSDSPVVEDPLPVPARSCFAAEPCLLQHSSGTTGLQRAVVLSHQAVLGHVRRYGEAIALTADDKVVSWLPLYHDMGLIAAFHLALSFGIPLVQVDPFEWVQAPVLMLEAMAGEGCTLAWLPNFAYHLMADRIRDEDLENIRLDRLRLLVNCSEPVRAEAHDKFLGRFQRVGVRAESLAACYAMAETTFAVTQTTPGLPAKRIFADREELARGRVRLVPPGPDARACVSSGRPISDTTLRVLDEHGQDLSDDRVGELVIRSASLFEGYRNNPVNTAAALRNGWYFSGDYGFRHEDEYYVIGRKKDIIIVAGRNIYPEDIEAAVSELPGAIPGRVVAFGVDDAALGTEQVAVLLESEKYDAPQARGLQEAVVKAGMDAGVTVAKVYVVPPRWLIKSSSGKPSRKANRERALTELASNGVNGGCHDFRSAQSGNPQGTESGRLSADRPDGRQPSSGLGFAALRPDP